MPTGRRSNAKGRSTGKHPFVMLGHFAFDCPAYRSLKPGPRALLWEFIRRHNGANNGRIAFSQRDMSKLINVTDRETVAGYVRKLEELGFIQVQKRGAFSVKVAARRASEWTLTMFPVGEAPATKEFMRWRPGKNNGTEKPTYKDGETVPQLLGNVRSRPTGSENPTRQDRVTGEPGTEIPSTYTSIAMGSGASGRMVARQGAMSGSSNRLFNNFAQLGQDLQK